MLSGGAKAAFAYDPRTGHELWRIEFDDFSVAPRPLYQRWHRLHGHRHHAPRDCGPSASMAEATSRDTDDVLWRLKSGVAKDGLAAVGRRPDLHGQRRRHRQLHRRRHRRARLAKAHRRPHSPPRRSTATAASTSATRTARRRSSNRAASSKSSPTNTLDDGCMASPAVDGEALILRTKTHLYRIEAAGPTGG